MLAAALAATLALGGGASSSGAAPLDLALALGFGATGGSRSGGAWVDVTLQSSHLTGGVRTGLLVLGEEVGGELGVTVGVALASRPGPTLEVLLDAGAVYYSRDARADDGALDVVYGEEVSGSSATLPFTQLRIGGSVPVADGRRLFTFGVYARSVERRDVTYSVQNCTLLGIACLPAQTETARYGGTSVGVYIGFAYLARLPRAASAPVAPERAAEPPTTR